MHPHSLIRATLPLLFVLAIAGCATTGKAPDERAQVLTVMHQWKQGVLANDIAQVMSLYSESFNSEGKNKAAIKVVMAETARRVVDQDGRLNIENADILISGDRASVMPVSIGTRKGAVCARIELAKENGRWLIVGMGKK